jgi:hypothetical protein
VTLRKLATLGEPGVEFETSSARGLPPSRVTGRLGGR